MLPSRNGVRGHHLHIVVALFTYSNCLFAAGGGDTSSLVTSSEALDETNEMTKVISHRPFELEPGKWSLSDFALLMGPSLNHLSGIMPEQNQFAASGTNGPQDRLGKNKKNGNTTPTPPSGSARAAASVNGSASAGRYGGTGGLAGGPHLSGYMLRDLIEASYNVNQSVKVGPVFEVDRKFYRSNDTTLGDPSVRLSVNHVVRAQGRMTDYDSGVWVSYAAPVSQMSRATSSYGAVSVSYIPTLLFAGSRFFLSGVAGASETVAENRVAGGMLYPLRLNASLSTNYRFNRWCTVFLSNSDSLRVGQNLVVGDTEALSDPSDALMGRFASGKTTSLNYSTGAYFRPTRVVSIGPRLSWSPGSDFDTATVFVSASFTIL